MGGMVLETSLSDIFIHSDAQFKLEKAEVSIFLLSISRMTHCLVHSNLRLFLTR